MKKVILFILCPILMFGQTQIDSDIDGEAAYDNSGRSVSLSSDGSIVAIGAPGNIGNGAISGHVRIYENQSGTWTQIGQDIDGEAAGDGSGSSVSLSSDGSIVAIGAVLNGDNGSNSGHVRIYENQSGTWTQIGQDINGEAASDQSGISVSLSSDGSILAIGAVANDGNGSNSGHVRIYENQSGTWMQIGQDVDGEAAADGSGNSVSLSSDGSILAIGARSNDGNGGSSGHVRVYENIVGVWTQIGQDIDGDTTADWAGTSVSLSSDGSIVAIGANQNNTTKLGKVKIYKNESGTWTQIGVNINGEGSSDQSGESVSLSSDGSIVAIGAPLNDGNGTNSGHVRVYDLSALLSIEEDNLFSFSMYPNPSKNQVNINLPSELSLEKIEVFSSIGLLVNTTQKTEINISSFSSGVYYVRITTSKGESVKKLIIE